MSESDIIVTLDDGVDLDLQSVDIGTADAEDVLSFTIDGLLRGVDADLLEAFAEKTVVPTEVHFRTERG